MSRRSNRERYRLEHVDVCDADSVRLIFDIVVSDLLRRRPSWFGGKDRSEKQAWSGTFISLLHVTRGERAI
jgi:hypothetical protein